MRKHLSLIVVVFLLCSICLAQTWSGVLAPARAIDWSGAGVPGGIPSSSWTQCGATISSGASAATINAAIVACGNNQYVKLGPGTFPGAIQILRNNVVLRGSGADQTFIQGASTTNCGGFGFSSLVNICTTDGTHDIGSGTIYNWTAGYSKGATSLTFASTTGITTGKLLFLDQADDGFTGLNSVTGSFVDNGNFEVCDVACSSEGSSTNAFRTHRAQIQIVVPTNVTSTTVTIPSPGLHAPNWRSGQSPGAWGPITYIHDVGLEDLTLDQTASNANEGVMLWGTYRAWVRGVRMVLPTGSKSGIFVIMSSHFQFENNYLYGIQRPQDPYGFQMQITADGLIVNNIFQQDASPIVFNGPDSGTVVAYNFAILDTNGSQGSWSFWNHSSGIAYQLWEGNSAAGFANDGIHGSKNMITRFRNHFRGKDDSNTQQVQPSFDAAFNRYVSHVGNVMGSSLQTIYESNNCCNPSNQIYVVGWGNTLADDSITNSSMMRWGNYDTVTGTVRFVNGEVPTSAPSYPNSIPADHNLAASWYYSAQPSWWPSGKVWPPIGPDVTGGNVSNTGGHANTIPAQDCYLNTMLGPSDGSGSALSFNAPACYTAASGPVMGLSPTSINFNNQNIGVQSSVQTSSLSNSGTAPSVISSIVKGGANAADFTVSNDCPGTLSNGSSCTISVTCTPSALGARSATVTVTDDAPSSPQILSLSCTGIGTPVAQILPTSLTFGPQNVATTSPSQAITLTNTGTDVLPITSIAIGGVNPGDFFQSNNCPVGGNLGIGAFCTVTTTFTPVTSGARSAVVVFTDGAAGSPQNISISGTGVSATSSSQINSGTVIKGGFVIK